MNFKSLVAGFSTTGSSLDGPKPFDTIAVACSVVIPWLLLLLRPALGEIPSLMIAQGVFLAVLVSWGSLPASVCLISSAAAGWCVYLDSSGFSGFGAPKNFQEMMFFILFGFGAIYLFEQYAAERSTISVDPSIELNIVQQEAARREKELRDDADLANRMKDEFLSTVSHELRTPLNAILGWTQLVRRRPMKPEQLAEGLDVIERNSRTLAGIIDELVDINRVISGKVRLDFHEFELASILDAAVASTKASAEAKGITITTETPLEQIRISIDVKRAEQIFRNLLSNAIKFSPQGGEVWIKVARTPTAIEISVTDSGEGVKAEVLPYIFLATKPLELPMRRTGLGLGLPVVKNLAELHGGTIEVRDGGEGKGAIFALSLPLSLLRDDPALRRQKPSEIEMQKAPDGAAALTGVKVLVVDDQLDARELARNLLEDFGAEVRTAESAVAGLEVLNGFNPDVLISDIGMPDIDGYEFLRRVRRRAPEHGGKVPAAALTAFVRPEDRLLALKAGYQMHLSKPVEPAELLQVVVNLRG